LQSFFEPKFKKSSKQLLLFLSGIIHGIFGLGGVVAIGTMKNSFAHKSQLRATFAVFFITLNINCLLLEFPFSLDSILNTSDNKDLCKN